MSDPTTIDFERLARSAFDSFLLGLGIPVEYRFEEGSAVGPWHELDERVRGAWVEAMREGASHAGRRIARDHVLRLMDENAHLRARPVRDHEQAATFALAAYEDALASGRIDREPALVAGEMAKVLSRAEAITAEQRDAGASELAQLRAERDERTWERDGLVALATQLGASEGQLARVVQDRIEVRRIQDEIGSLEARDTIEELRAEIERLRAEAAERDADPRLSTVVVGVNDRDTLLRRVREMEADAKLGAIVRSHATEPYQVPFARMSHELQRAQQHRASRLFFALAEALGAEEGAPDADR